MIYNGDCLEVLKKLEANSVDSLVTDPPAGISFMGKDWDSDKGGRDQWIKWMCEVMSLCYVAMKPGAHGLVWALPRTSHWTAMALEDAGFEIRDVITHLFGSGFPKSLNVSKAIDKAAGAEREVIGPKKDSDGRIRAIEPMSDKIKIANGRTLQDSITKPSGNFETIPSTNDAKQWDGWGTALKPAVEMWWLVRKPLSEKTVAANVLKWGTGGINIDGCRIGTSKRIPGSVSNPHNGFEGKAFKIGKRSLNEDGHNPNLGRFPANLVLSHSPYCTDGQCDIECAIALLDEQTKDQRAGKPSGSFSCRPKRENIPNSTKSIKDRGELEKKSGYENGPVSGASRFFFQAKHDTLAPWDIQENVIKDVKDAENNSLKLLFQIRDFVLENAATQNMDLKKEELQVFLDCIGSSKSFIQIRNLVSHVMHLENTDTIEIIQSLWKLYGCVCDAIDKNIKLENQKKESDQVKATRFLYSAKVSPSERNAGLDGMPDKQGGIKNTSGRGFSESDPHKEILTKNNHPTVKPQKLMRYFCKLITPPKGTVLDPFMGSGSTGLAAKSEGFKFIGIEKEKEYFEIAQKRIG